MRRLPTGTVTFLFTDVAGSTRLLEELGAEGYAEALGSHRRVIRDALDRHGGIEVDTQGDCAGDRRRALRDPLSRLPGGRAAQARRIEVVRALAAELTALDDDYGYGGLAAATRAWLAWRDGNLDAVDLEAGRALAGWSHTEGTGPTVFQWTARFPLIAAELERGRTAPAADHAAFLLDASQQPLPEELAAALRDGTLERAVALGRPLGYT